MKRMNLIGISFFLSIKEFLSTIDEKGIKEREKNDRKEKKINVRIAYLLLFFRWMRK
jgi:hypothetical protein